MFCPSCGSKNTFEQKFCRACGLNLEQTAISVRAQHPEGGNTELTRREQALERFGQLAFGGFGLVLAAGIIGIIYTIFTKMVLSGSQPLAGIMLILFVFFAGLALAYVAFAEDLKEKKKKVRAESVSALPLSTETGKLIEERTFEPAASIIEDTTDLLPLRNDTRKF